MQPTSRVPNYILALAFALAIASISRHSTVVQAALNIGYWEGDAGCNKS